MASIHILFHGQVQRVGFRRTTQRLGTSLSLSGWVRNMPDGTVEMRAWGDEPSLKQLMTDLYSLFRIERTETKEPAPEEPAPSGFEIR